MIPAVDGLLPEPWNGKLITLLFRLAEWHALAKLRMHTERSLSHLSQATAAIGRELRSFKEWTKGFNPVELPRETAARERRKQKKNIPENAPGSHPRSSLSENPPNPAEAEKTTAQQKIRVFNLLTYKVHALGDYVAAIKDFGTTDSYSTQIVSELSF